MVPEYKYQCIDESIITPYFKKWIVSPLIKFLPLGIPANLITIFANLFLYLALALSFIELKYRLEFILIPLCIFIYALGDHFDGMQAKRTKTGSALGEFCDHYLDIINNGILLMIMIKIFDVNNFWIVLSLFLVSYLSHTAVIYEEYKTKWLVFEKIGSLEAVFIMLVLILISYFETVHAFLMTPFSISKISVSPIALFMICSILGTVMTFIKCGIRIKKKVNTRVFSLGFILYAFSLIFVGFCLYYFQFSQFVLFLIISFYGASYIGGLMKSHLVDGEESFPDLVVPIIFLVTLFIALFLGKFFKMYDIDGPTQMVGVVFIYTVIINLKLVWRVFAALQKYWFWWNPTIKDV